MRAKTNGKAVRGFRAGAHAHALRRSAPRRRLGCASLLLCAALAGCRPGPATGAAPGSRRLKVGPSLDRLAQVLNDRSKAAPEKEAYWDSVKGTLVSARGRVVAVAADRVKVEQAVKSGETVRVTAYPRETDAAYLASVREGQELRVQGEIGGKGRSRGTSDSPEMLLFELRSATIRLR
jgi:hypothetical protein